jgi:hypothetical protein
MVVTVRRSPIVARPPVPHSPLRSPPSWTVRRPPHSRVTTPLPPLHQAGEEWRRRAFLFQAIGAGYLSPIPVQNRTTRSSPDRKPDPRKVRIAAQVAAASGAA